MLATVFSKRGFTRSANHLFRLASHISSVFILESLSRQNRGFWAGYRPLSPPGPFPFYFGRQLRCSSNATRPSGLGDYFSSVYNCLWINASVLAEDDLD